MSKKTKINNLRNTSSLDAVTGFNPLTPDEILDIKKKFQNMISLADYTSNLPNLETEQSIISRESTAVNMNQILNDAYEIATSSQLSQTLLFSAFATQVEKIKDAYNNITVNFISAMPQTESNLQDFIDAIQTLPIGDALLSIMKYVAPNMMLRMENKTARQSQGLSLNLPTLQQKITQQQFNTIGNKIDDLGNFQTGNQMNNNNMTQQQFNIPQPPTAPGTGPFNNNIALQPPQPPINNNIATQNNNQQPPPQNNTQQQPQNNTQQPSTLSKTYNRIKKTVVNGLMPNAYKSDDDSESADINSNLAPSAYGTMGKTMNMALGNPFATDDDTDVTSVDTTNNNSVADLNSDLFKSFDTSESDDIQKHLTPASVNWDQPFSPVVARNAEIKDPELAEMKREATRLYDDRDKFIELQQQFYQDKSNPFVMGFPHTPLIESSRFLKDRVTDESKDIMQHLAHDPSAATAYAQEDKPEAEAQQKNPFNPEPAESTDILQHLAHDPSAATAYAQVKPAEEHKPAPIFEDDTGKPPSKEKMEEIKKTIDDNIHLLRHPFDQEKAAEFLLKFIDDADTVEGETQRKKIIDDRFTEMYYRNGPYSPEDEEYIKLAELEYMTPRNIVEFIKAHNGQAVNYTTVEITKPLQNDELVRILKEEPNNKFAIKYEKQSSNGKKELISNTAKNINEAYVTTSKDKQESILATLSEGGIILRNIGNIPEFIVEPDNAPTNHMITVTKKKTYQNDIHEKLVATNHPEYVGSLKKGKNRTKESAALVEKYQYLINRAVDPKISEETRNTLLKTLKDDHNISLRGAGFFTSNQNSGYPYSMVKTINTNLEDTMEYLNGDAADEELSPGVRMKAKELEKKLKESKTTFNKLLKENKKLHEQVDDLEAKIQTTESKKYIMDCLTRAFDWLHDHTEIVSLTSALTSWYFGVTGPEMAAASVIGSIGAKYSFPLLSKLKIKTDNVNTEIIANRANNTNYINSIKNGTPYIPPPPIAPVPRRQPATTTIPTTETETERERSEGATIGKSAGLSALRGRQRRQRDETIIDNTEALKNIDRITKMKLYKHHGGLRPQRGNPTNVHMDNFLKDKDLTGGGVITDILGKIGSFANGIKNGVNDTLAQGIHNFALKPFTGSYNIKGERDKHNSKVNADEARKKAAYDLAVKRSGRTHDLWGNPYNVHGGNYTEHSLGNAIIKHAIKPIFKGGSVKMAHSDKKQIFRHFNGHNKIGKEDVDEWFNESMEHLRGSGIFDAIKTTFSPSNNKYYKNTQAMLNKYGNDKINSISISRTNIPKAINMIYSKILPYDQLYHLALIVNVTDNNGNNKNIIVEKNSYIFVSNDYHVDDSTQTMQITGQLPHTINEMLDLTRDKVGNNTFYLYDPLGNNCQNFLINILNANHINNPNLQKFILQDQIAKTPQKFTGKVLGKLGRFVTDSHSFVKGKILGGDAQLGSDPSTYSPFPMDTPAVPIGYYNRMNLTNNNSNNSNNNNNIPGPIGSSPSSRTPAYLRNVKGGGTFGDIMKVAASAAATALGTETGKEQLSKLKEGALTGLTKLILA